VPAGKNKLILFCIISLIILFYSSAQSSALKPDVFKPKKYLDKEFFILLLNVGPPFPGMVEFVELFLSDDGSFHLNSDFWAAPAEGIYEKNILVLKAEGTTDRYIEEYLGEIKLSYNFVGLPLGFQAFFMLGIGTRQLTFGDNSTISAPFMFWGPGF
jgi:hypothetical protein